MRVTDVDVPYGSLCNELCVVRGAPKHFYFQPLLKAINILCNHGFQFTFLLKLGKPYVSSVGLYIEINPSLVGKSIKFFGIGTEKLQVIIVSGG